MFSATAFFSSGFSLRASLAFSVSLLDFSALAVSTFFFFEATFLLLDFFFLELFLACALLLLRFLPPEAFHSFHSGLMIAILSGCPIWRFVGSSPLHQLLWAGVILLRDRGQRVARFDLVRDRLPLARLFGIGHGAPGEPEAQERGNHDQREATKKHMQNSNFQTTGADGCSRMVDGLYEDAISLAKPATTSARESARNGPRKRDVSSFVNHPDAPSSFQPRADMVWCRPLHAVLILPINGRTLPWSALSSPFRSPVV